MTDNNTNFDQNQSFETVYDPSSTKTEQQSSEIENKPGKKRGGFKKVLKAAAAVIALALVSVGSISGYKYVEENGFPFTGKDKSESHESRELPRKEENNNGKTTQNSTIDRSEFKNKSVLKISEKDKVLATQGIYQKVMPSVVGITSVFEVQNQTFSFFGFGDSNQGTQQVPGTGTGIVMSSDGYILTNAHVISEEDYGVASEITVMLQDQTEYPAEVVGCDTQTDIAVLKIDAKDMTPAEFGSSSALEVGDPALAIGNPLGFDLFGTLTVGYISGLNREVNVNDNTFKLIQTDAAINSGNSGGPLINECGQVIGINSMKMSASYSSNTAAIEGLGFAIPIDDAKKIVDDLMAFGYVSGGHDIGITYRDLSTHASSSGTSGVQVTGITPDGPADKAGIEVGDIIVGVDDEFIGSASDMKKILSTHKAGDKLRLTIVRNRSYYDVKITLEDSMPNE